MAILVGTARGQDRGAAGDRRPDPLQGTTSQVLRELDARLGLSPDQKAQLVQLKKDFQAKHRDELRQLRENVQRVRQEVRQARQTKNALAVRSAGARARDLRQTAERLRAEFEAQLLGVLTDAQKQQYRAIQKELARPGKRAAQ